MKSKFGLGAVLAGGLLACANVAFAQDDDDGNYTYLSASLFNEEAKGKNADASGDFSAEANLDTGEICYLLEVADMQGATAAHIHRGGKGKTGEAVAKLTIAAGAEDDETCETMDGELLRQIAKKPGSFYVAVSTEAKPAGAIRGQLEN